MEIIKNEELLTPKELAAFFKVSIRTVYQWIYLGLITPMRLHPGNRGPVRFTWNEVERFMSRKKGSMSKCQKNQLSDSPMGITKSENLKELEGSSKH